MGLPSLTLIGVTSTLRMSKVPREILAECVSAVLKGSTEKKRKFLESVDLQIGLKNYDPQKDKRFSGTVKLVNPRHTKGAPCSKGRTLTQSLKTWAGLGNLAILFLSFTLNFRLSAHYS